MNYRDYPESRRRPPMRGDRSSYEPSRPTYWDRGEPYPQSDRDAEAYDRGEAEYYSRDREHGGQPAYRREPRGLMERAADEMRSWFGDEDAERRRWRDERSGGRGRWADREPRYGRDRGRDDVDEQRWARQWGYVDPMQGRGVWGRSTTNAPYSPALYAPASESSGVYPGVPSEAPGWTPGSGYRDTWTVRGPYTGRGPRNFQRSDERIREEVCDRLWQHGGIDATDVEVSVKAGEVTLQGSVEDRGQRRVAEAMAESVWGVQQVQNLIRVGRAAPEARRHEESERAA